jgi:hypothetical protein
MNIEKLNEIMNCDCLQKIIENDLQKCNYLGSTSLLGVHRKDYKKAMENGRISILELKPVNCEIYFDTRINYRKILTPIIKNHITCDTGINKMVEEYCGVPFLYCPICGTKTKSIVNGFYSKFQE